jgi:guanylate kinase
MNPRRGIALVVCAPSGAGKTTLVKRLLAEFSDFAYSISYTTRAPRDGEINGRDYHFVDRETFIGLRNEDFFAEWAEVHGNFYGTPLGPVRELLAAGKDLLFDIDVQGARQLRGKLDGAHVFIFPPSRAALEQRLKGRGTDSSEVVARRLNNARAEIEAAADFDYWIVNDDLDLAYAHLRSAYLAAGLKPQQRPDLLAALLRGWGE